MVRSTRDDILAAAADLFAATGFKGTSLQDIAAEVGCSKATLLYHFDGKDAILAALIEPAVRALAALDATVAAATDSEAAQRTAVEGFVALTIRFRREVAVLYADLPELLSHATFHDVPAHTERLVVAFSGGRAQPGDRVAALLVLCGVPPVAVKSPTIDDAELGAELVQAAMRALNSGS